MTSLAQQSLYISKYVPSAILPDEHVGTMKNWLRGDDPSLVIGHLMYVTDEDSSRWVRGHSSKTYYVKREEDKVREIMLREIEGKYDVVADFGVGGAEAVKRVLTLGRKVGARAYIGTDLAVDLALAAAEVARREGFQSEAMVSDIFEKLPQLAKKLELLSKKLSKKELKTLIGIFGLTPGNLEYYDSFEALEKRDTQIHLNYAQALAHPKKGGLLTGWDGNMNAAQVQACYENPEFGELVVTCPSRFMDIGGLKYRVLTKEMQSASDSARKVLRLSTGLYAEQEEMVPFAGEEFVIKKGRFLPVVLSYRKSIPYQQHVLEKGGFRWRDSQVWNASGPIHYAHCSLT